MSKVYLVTSGEYSDYSVDGAFSSEDKAKAWIGSLTEIYSIEEHNLDPDPDEARGSWTVWIPFRGGRAEMYQSCEAPSSTGSIMSDVDFLERTVERRVFLELSASLSRDACAKAANEIRARLLATHGECILAATGKAFEFDIATMSLVELPPRR